MMSYCRGLTNLIIFFFSAQQSFCGKLLKLPASIADCSHMMMPVGQYMVNRRFIQRIYLENPFLWNIVMMTLKFEAEPQEFLSETWHSLQKIASRLPLIGKMFVYDCRLVMQQKILKRTKEECSALNAVSVFMFRVQSLFFLLSLESQCRHYDI